MTAVAADAPAGPRPATPAMGWRRLGWVAWRRQRTMILAALGVMAGAALVLLLSRLAIQHAADRFGPGWWAQIGRAGYYSWALGLPDVLQALPLLIGALAGAPLLAREAESGTAMFTWTQGVGRIRLLTVQLMLVVVILAPAAAGLGVLFDWWIGPLIRGATMSRWTPSSVDLFAPSLAGWVVFGLLFGLLCGAVLRRTVAAIAVTLAGYAALAYVTATRLRGYYLPPLTGPQAWVSPATSGGHVIPQTAHVLTTFFAFPGGRPLTSQQIGQGTAWFSQHHIVAWGLYQPASRFWPLQWLELGWLSAVSLLLAGATFLIIRRRGI
jgi:hypothetical protein